MEKLRKLTVEYFKPMDIMFMTCTISKHLKKSEESLMFRKSKIFLTLEKPLKSFGNLRNDDFLHRGVKKMIFLKKYFILLTILGKHYPALKLFTFLKKRSSCFQSYSSLNKEMLLQYSPLGVL